MHARCTVVSWRQLQKTLGPAILQRMNDDDVGLKCLSRVANTLVDVFQVCVTSEDPLSARATWDAVPLTRSECSDLRLLDSVERVLAYALNWFLDRYWRTWFALDQLLCESMLPMGTRGVHCLDVGSGPGQSAFATQDYYEAIRRVAGSLGLDAFHDQTTEVYTSECLSNMSSFANCFAELSGRPGPFRPIVPDFAAYSPDADRRVLFERLRDEWVQGDDPCDWWPVRSPAAAHEEANMLHRYRLVTVGNVLTDFELLGRFSDSLTWLFHDCGPGTLFLVFGAGGKKYAKIYDSLIEHARDLGTKKLPQCTKAFETSTNDRIEAKIKETQYRIFGLLESASGHDLPREQPRWPDYWSDTPNPKKSSKFTMVTLRRGRFSELSKVS